MTRLAALFAAVSISSLAALAGIGCSDGGQGGDRTCASDNAALSVCAAGATVKGVDVSTYQGAVSWSSAKAAGIQFAFARISDGTANPDDQFVANWKGMKSAGIIRGAYQFFRPSVDPTAQVNLVMSKLQAAGGFEANDLPIVMDIEVTDNLTPAQIQAAMKPWLTQIEQKTSKKPIIYTAAFMSSNIGNAFNAYPLWVANYGVSCPTMPADFTAWKFWQDGDNGTVSGISGGVDTDVWNGTLAQLQSFAGSANNPPPAHDAGTVGDAGNGSHDGGTTHDAGATLGSGGQGGSSSSGQQAGAGSNPCGG